MDAEPLLDSTLRLLDATNLTLRQIAEGASVDREWLAKLKQRAIPEPGVNKVQRVFWFLNDYENVRTAAFNRVKDGDSSAVHGLTHAE